MSDIFLSATSNQGTRKGFTLVNSFNSLQILIIHNFVDGYVYYISKIYSFLRFKWF